MEKLIKDIVELDKTYRSKVNELRAELDKIGGFVAKQKDKIKDQYQKAADDKISQKKQEIEADLEKRKSEAASEYKDTLAKMEKTFAQNSQKWIDEIYSYCIKEE